MRIETFNNTIVQPYTRKEEFGKKFCGGAMLPEGTDPFVRHQRGKDFYDVPPAHDETIKPSRYLAGEYLFAGALVGHFGHQISEFTHRLWPLFKRPYKVIFVASDGYTQVPAFLKELVAFFGGESIVVVSEHTIVEKLTIAESGKFLTQPVKQWYLEKLNEFWSRKPCNKDLYPKKLAVLRSHLQTGRIVGERHLEDHLKEAGYFLFRPEDFGLIEQINFYRAADSVIFSEGSAIHGLDVAPSIAAKAIVLMRRTGSRIGKDTLEPRCAHYHEFDEVTAITTLSSKGGNDLSVVPIHSFVERIRNDIDSSVPSIPNIHPSILQRDIKTYVHFHRGENQDFTDITQDDFKASNSLSLDSTAPAPTTSAAKLLKRLSTLNNTKNYLEIGLHRGRTFFNVDAPRKHGVDVSFRFDVDSAKKPGVQFFKMESDTYFSKLDSSALFDLVYVDGFHRFEQVVRDFTNSLSHAHPKTIWLLSSTIPTDFFSSIPDPESSVKMRRSSGDHEKKEWHGNAYKIIFLLESFFPSLSYSTVFLERENSHATVVWQEPRTVGNDAGSTLGIVDSVDYARLLTAKKTFRVCEEDSLIFRIKKHFSKPQTDERFFV